MTLLDALSLMAQNLGTIRTVLQNAVANNPDLAPVLEPIIAALDSPGSPENLLRLVAALPPEVGNIVVGNFDQRPHAGDSV